VNPADPAGAIIVRLQTRAGHVDTVDLVSGRRPDIARRLFAGRPLDDLLKDLPRLFSICATAQACATVGACEDATGIVLPPAHRRARELLVRAETVREHLLRILLGWSDWLGRPPAVGDLGVLGRMRQAWEQAVYPDRDGLSPGGGHLSPDRDALDALVGRLQGLLVAVLGVPATAWQSFDDMASLHRWARAGDAVAQDMVEAVIDPGLAGLGASAVSFLPRIADDSLAARLDAGDADNYAALPEWDGVPCETGALARRVSTPPVAMAHDAHGNGVLTRLLARLSELVDDVQQIAREVERLEPAGPTPGVAVAHGDGIAQIEAARGRLVHRLRLRDGRVEDIRILAPTEWNFHPAGALARGLATLPVGDDLPRLARLLVDAVDPCVECRVEVDAHD